MTPPAYHELYPHEIDEEDWHRLVQLRGGCNCCVTPPCFNCTEPMTMAEAGQLGLLRDPLDEAGRMAMLEVEFAIDRAAAREAAESSAQVRALRRRFQQRESDLICDIHLRTAALVRGLPPSPWGHSERVRIYLEQRLP